MQWCHSSTECGAFGNTTWARELPPLLLHKRSVCHHKSQAIGDNTKKRCGNAISVTTMHPTMKYTSIECESYISLAQTYTSQTGYPTTTTEKTRPGN